MNLLSFRLLPYILQSQFIGLTEHGFSIKFIVHIRKEGY